MASSVLVNFFSFFFQPVNVFIIRLTFVILVFSLMQKIFGSKQKSGFLILALIGVLTQFHLWLEYTQVTQFVISYAILLSLSFIISLSNFAFSKSVPFSELKTGMIPAVYIIFNKEKKKYDKHRIYNRGLIATAEKRGDKFLIDSTQEGLADEDIAAIKKAHSERILDFDRVEIYETLPFAPIISIGVVLTILFSGSIFAIIG